MIAHRDSFTVHYYSERDVSGLFYINCGDAYLKNKSHIKLLLIEEINFSDEIFFIDYEKEKERFFGKSTGTEISILILKKLEQFQD